LNINAMPLSITPIVFTGCVLAKAQIAVSPHLPPPYENELRALWRL
jgi:hypothetical protein